MENNVGLYSILNLKNDILEFSLCYFVQKHKNGVNGVSP